MNSFRIGICCLVLSSMCAATGCKAKPKPSTGTDGAMGAPATKSSEAPAAATPTPAPLPPAALNIPRPSGPSFAVEPGAGLGPIRFGSTVATVERHMQTKCEDLTEKHCRYIAAGIDLELNNGAVSGIVIHRFNRPVDGDPTKKWGTFAGGIPPKVMLMMVPEAVIEQIGKPKRTEAVKGDNPNWTVRRDYYDGMVLEYDKNRANDRLMLGEIRVVKR